MDENEICNLFDALTTATCVEPDITCCNKECNYILKGTMLTCKICESIISNVCLDAEWRYYGIDDNKNSDPNRCGMPVNVLLPKSSIGSTISNKGSTNKNAYKVKRFQDWNGMTYKERSKYKIFTEIKAVCEKNDIQLIIIKEASSLYSIASEVKITRGNNRKGLIAACVYFACKNCNVPRSSKEISKIFEIKSILVTKGIKNLQETLQMSNTNNRINKINTINQNDFIERFCYKLNIEGQHIKNIMNISKKTIENNIISENTPPSIAAGCIYLYVENNKLNISKKIISNTCGISEVTINKCYIKIKSHNKLLLDNI
tara:strand:- start:779 stop:1729 length:951 start_codon:yes stop_codon:yes gene_type:complete